MQSAPVHYCSIFRHRDIPDSLRKILTNQKEALNLIFPGFVDQDKVER
jgi:hypothetical protein